MNAINDNKALQFLESLHDERQRSAVIAIHVAWLRYAPADCASTPTEADSSIDMEILYKAAAATFQHWPPPHSPVMAVPQGGHILHGEQALQRLQSVSDEEIRLLATLFVQNVITLSSTATSEQDLNCQVELFLRAISDKSVIGNIVSGAISRHSDHLSDADFW